MEYNGFPAVRGRGMVKWSPFASMPEQYEEIRRMFEEQYKGPKPFLTQDTMERIERALMQSLHEEEEIFISYYRDGYIHDEYITVIDIDKQNKTVHYTDAFGLNTRLKFEEFVDIK
ncbi:YolD-like family protein [Bacillus cereus group sp. MYBK227-1]|uniref:YolD-like family protein n=1 Tax=Bacillus cereus group sp. MYBK227-1 TaxID=3450654 RepID=UPI003F7B0518